VTVKVFRWKAIGPLLLLLVIVGILWLIFADRIARHETQKVATQVLGARVDINDLHLDVPHGQVRIHGLTIANPHEAFKNLLQADEIVVDLDVVPLTEKKIIINRVAANGLRFGTARATDGRVAAKGGGGIAGRVYAEAAQWASQFQVPVLQLATGKLSIDSLDPRRLSTIPAAEALAARADSSRKAWQSQFDTLRIGPTIDSAKATLDRLQRARATDIATINDARQMIERLKQARDRVTNLEQGVKRGVAGLNAGLAGLDSARRRDYAFARSLLKLPSFEAPSVGSALFAPGAIKPFERMLYWVQLARRYMPPGLLPRASTATKRLRRAGEDMRFPQERALPGFLLRSAEISFLLHQTQRYAGRISGLTSDPAIFGRPTVLAASGPQLAAGGLLNHVRGTPLDTAGASVGGIHFPAFSLPGVPLRLDPGAATTELGFNLNGDTLNARFAVRSTSVRWDRDSGFANSQIADLIWRAVSGISNLQLEARVFGALQHPQFAVRSNLDQAIATRLRAVLGEQVAAAEQRMRVRVDSMINDKVGPVRTRVAGIASQTQAQVAQQRGQVDDLQRALEQRLRDMLGGIRLP
jgi:uncharacterized protein (TIGR03545 family)